MDRPRHEIYRPGPSMTNVLPAQGCRGADAPILHIHVQPNSAKSMTWSVDITRITQNPLLMNLFLINLIILKIHIFKR